MLDHRESAFKSRTLHRMAVCAVLVAASAGLLAVGAMQATAQSTGRVQRPKFDVQVGIARNAPDAFTQIISSYESGEYFGVASMLDPTMVGMQTLLNHIRDTQNQQKEIEIRLTDVKSTSSTDLAVITFNWEKRYLALPQLTPKIVTGHSSFLLQSSSGGWRLSGIAGDNLFAAQAR